MAEQGKTIFYVSPDGKDTWSGKLAEPNAQGTDGPLATLAGARDAIRAMPPKERVGHPITVLLRGGTYFLSEPVVFTAQDSGTFAAPITYAAYPGETPIISGGKLIHGDWRPYQGDIMVCSVPAAANGQWVFRRLAVNGKVKNRARLPKEDFYRIEERVYESAFKYAEGDLWRFHNLEDAEVVVFHSWNESRLIIQELDEERRVVKFTGAPERSHYFGWRGVKNRYYVENIREGLTEPGDWYLDSRAGELYYWPEEGEDLTTAEVVAPVLKELVRFQPDIEQGKWVSYLTFSGITFSDTDFPLPATGYPGCGDVGDIVEPSALNLKGARRCSVEDCCIKNIGTYGLFITGPGNRIIGNEIYDTGSGGIVTRNYTSEHMTVSYNHVHHCGAVYPSAVGINIDDGGGIFSHNLVHDVAHSGIYARHWPTGEQPLERDNQEEGLVIEYNEIYNVVAPINDGAGIFVRDSDMIVRNNLIHDCYSYGDGTPGWGIYLGCRSRNSRVENNLVYRTRESVHIWYGNENTTWINNIFVNGLKTQINYTNATDTDHVNIRFLQNIVCWQDAEATLFVISGDHSLPEQSDYNVYYQTGGAEMRIDRLPGIENYQQWLARGFDAHSTVADPLFVDPANDDYTLQPDSPALKLGFQPL
ncbi:MAG: hypothetical protein GX552_12380, partial [Chloroflexi bacterium]|nr:hypothetical protein [Chloroflexota bacterium]